MPEAPGKAGVPGPQLAFAREQQKAVGTRPTALVHFSSDERLRGEHGLGIPPRAAGKQLAQRADIGARRRYQSVGIGAPPRHGLFAVLEPYDHLGLRVGSFRDRAHLVERQTRLVRHDFLDSYEGRINRAVAGRLVGLLLAVDLERDGRLLWAAGAGNHSQCHHFDAVMGRGDLLIDQSLDILVIDMLLAVSERLEAHEGVLEGIVAELITELLQLLPEGMAAGMLAHDQRGFLQAYALRRHDLEGLGMLQHAVLMDTAFVRKGVPPDDRLVVLDGKGSDAADEA